MVTEHTLLTIETDTGPPPMPLFASRFHYTLSHLYPSAFHEDLSPRRCNSVLVLAHTTSRTAETEISSAWQYRRNAEDFHSPAAKMTLIGEPAAASEVAISALFFGASKDRNFLWKKLYVVQADDVERTRRCRPQTRQSQRPSWTHTV